MSYDQGQIKGSASVGDWNKPDGWDRYDKWFFVTLPWENTKYIDKHITKEWCEDNCEGKWDRDRIFKVDEAMYFESESDQIKFILWM